MKNEIFIQALRVPKNNKKHIPPSTELKTHFMSACSLIAITCLFLPFMHFLPFWALLEL